MKNSFAKMSAVEKMSVNVSRAKTLLESLRYVIEDACCANEEEIRCENLLDIIGDEMSAIEEILDSGAVSSK